MTLRSAAFADGASIPALYTCEGKDVPPPLEVNNVPARAKSLALIVHDPDAPDPKAPRMTWTHWVLYGLPPATRSLPEGVSAGTLPAGTREGLNDWKRPGYGGPCPPVGRHRYFFTLYALDVSIEGVLHGETPTREGLLAAMRGHVLQESVLMGTYEKQRKPPKQP